jgi:hypothetical protein
MYATRQSRCHRRFHAVSRAAVKHCAIWNNSQRYHVSPIPSAVRRKRSSSPEYNITVWMRVIWTICDSRELPVTFELTSCCGEQKKKKLCNTWLELAISRRPAKWSAAGPLGQNIVVCGRRHGNHVVSLHVCKYLTNAQAGQQIRTS